MIDFSKKIVIFTHYNSLVLFVCILLIGDTTSLTSHNIIVTFKIYSIRGLGSQRVQREDATKHTEKMVIVEFARAVVMVVCREKG